MVGRDRCSQGQVKKLQVKLELAELSEKQAGAKQAGAEADKGMYQQREAVWEEREQGWKDRMVEQEDKWRAKVAAAMEDMHANHPMVLQLRQQLRELDSRGSSRGGSGGGGAAAGRRRY